MTKILGLSGKKQSGKNTSANFLVGLQMTSLQIVKGRFRINLDGSLSVSDLFGDESYAGIFDIFRKNEAIDNFKKEHLDPFIKVYSFADMLKEKICIEILGLSREQVFGTDEQKNTLTHLLWENMPGVITEMLPEIEEDEIDTVGGRLGPYYIKLRNGVVYHKPGLMTAREVMQYVGTEIFRKMYYNVWVDATLRQIKLDQPELAVIVDVRFPNEVEGILKENGKVGRFTKAPFEGKDEHESEKALDKDRFDWKKFSFIWDNKTLSIPHQNEMVYHSLNAFGWVPEVVTFNNEGN